jgi:hypothetical protein
VSSTRSTGASRGFGVVLVFLAGVVAVPVCGITALAAAGHYGEASWPIEFTVPYLAAGAAWLALVVTTVSGQPRLIAGSFLAVLAVLVVLLTFYLTRLT